MSDNHTRSQPGPPLPWLISGIGGLSFAGFLGWCLWFWPQLPTPAIGLGTLTVGLPALVLVGGSYRLERSQISADRYARIAQWTVGIGGGFLALNILVMVFFPWYSLSGNVAWAHFSLNMGALGGFAIGFVEARAIQREVDATAAAVRADGLANEREVLLYLNDLLRHEVLNSAQIINGHASLVLENETPVSRTHLETIKQESEALTDVIDDIRAIITANQKQGAANTINISTLLREEVTYLEQRSDDVAIETDIPDNVFVTGNSGIKWIFVNVLENALEHNTSDSPHVAVTMTTESDTVTVEIADNGPGIPPETQETLFERKSSNHGLGLYLVDILTDRYNGTVEVTETSPAGSVFTVTLPRASDQETADVDAPTETTVQSEVETGNQTAVRND